MPGVDSHRCSTRVCVCPPLRGYSVPLQHEHRTGLCLHAFGRYDHYQGKEGFQEGTVGESLSLACVSPVMMFFFLESTCLEMLVRWLRGLMVEDAASFPCGSESRS